jgi:hypothetical protein
MIAKASSGQIFIADSKPCSLRQRAAIPLWRHADICVDEKGSCMVECKEFVGKIISSFKLYEDSIDGPEICIEFTDGTVFSSCLKTSTALEAKVTRNEGGHPRVLKDYSTPPVSR